MSHQRPVLIFFLIILITPPPPTYAFLLGQYRTLISLSHSLMIRVANSRASKGDLAGADRARKIADHLTFLKRGGSSIWSMGWDFAWNYAWGGGLTTSKVSRAISDLLSALSEAYQLKSSPERARWAILNNGRLRRLANSLLESLLSAFSKSGPLREGLLLLQREVLEGELLKDCMEVGAGDLEGMLRIVRDLFSEGSGVVEL